MDTTFFYVVGGLWIVAEVLLNRLVSESATTSKVIDQRFETYFWMNNVSSVFVGVWIAMNYNTPLVANRSLQVLGSCFMLGGILFRMVAIRQHGRIYPVNVAMHTKHPLPTTGLYRYLLHPSYTGSLFTFFLLGIALNNWLSLLVMFLPVFASFWYRMEMEEKALLTQFGDTYRTYQQARKRLIPFIY